MGFQLAEGPLVEEARFNFDMLNIPLEHPARAETDTFYLENGHILRTHTSPVQVRTVLENNLTPPFKIFSPGRTFRSEKTDATHESTFHQFEGLAVGDNITIAGFKGDIEQIFARFFGQNISVRLRTSYFPFVEPGFEVDISCVFCQAKGCRVCKHSGWIEVMGAGMVHPNVLRNMNINPEKYQGYAFGGAIDRLTMLRHGINDIRLFWSGDIDFLRQFS
jgi:phenylalanyl-tRNA synthetase alpha chain